MKADASEYHLKRLNSFACEKTPLISLSFKLVPVHYREHMAYFNSDRFFFQVVEEK